MQRAYVWVQQQKEAQEHVSKKELIEIEQNTERNITITMMTTGIIILLLTIAIITGVIIHG